MQLRRIAAPMALLSAVAFAPAASAHVTLQPQEVPAGAFKRLDVRVPNERDNASTKKVQVQFPPGFIFVSYEPVPGWTGKVAKEKLEKPIESHGEEHTEQVSTVTFSTKGEGIRPGQFRDFGLSVGLPDKPNTTLTFKALQTYSNGEVVRWIGPEDADEPAAQVKLTAAEGGRGASQPEEEAAAPAAGGDDGDSDTLPVIAIVVGALGLLAGLAGLGAARRARPAG
jgi:periplasmic copper chaperone A